MSAPKENKCWEREALGALPKEQLIELVMALQERVAELERRLGMNSQNSSRPPSSDLPGTERAKPPATGRRPGGQAGHPGQFRKMLPLDRVDKLVPLKPLQCRHCGASLTGEDPSPRRHQVVELPPIRPRVTEYQQHKLRCSCCGQTTVGEWPAGLDYGAFGERLRSLVALCTGVCHLSRRRTAFLLESLFHVPISVGAISRSEQFVSAAIAEPVQQCQQYVQSQPVVHVDETGWPIKYHTEGVEPTNNAAEQAIRPAVLWRKSCFGSQGPPGCRFVERMLTVTATLGLQRRNVVEYLTQACHAALHGHAAPSLLPLALSPAGT